MGEKYFTAQSLADLWECSRGHVYSLIKKGELTATYIGGLLRIKPDDVNSYERNQCQEKRGNSRNHTSNSEETESGISIGQRTVSQRALQQAQKIRQKQNAL